MTGPLPGGLAFSLKAATCPGWPTTIKRLVPLMRSFWEGLKVIWNSQSLSLWNKLKITMGLGAMALWAWVKEKWDAFAKAMKPITDALGELWHALMGFWKVLYNAVEPILSAMGVALGIVATILGGVFLIAIKVVTVAVNILTAAMKLVSWPFRLVGTIVYNLYVAINNAIQFILNLLNPFSSGNQLPYRPLPTLAEGGRILSEGAAYLHANEIVVPAQTAPLAMGGGTRVIDNRIYLDGGLLWHGMKKANQREERRKTGSSVGSRAWRSS